MSDESPPTLCIRPDVTRFARQNSERLAHRDKCIIAVTLRADEAVLINGIDDDVTAPREVLDPSSIDHWIHAEIAVEENDDRSRDWRRVGRFVEVKCTGADHRFP